MGFFCGVCPSFLTMHSMCSKMRHVFLARHHAVSALLKGWWPSNWGEDGTPNYGILRDIIVEPCWNQILIAVLGSSVGCYRFSMELGPFPNPESVCHGFHLSTPSVAFCSSASSKLLLLLKPFRQNSLASPVQKALAHWERLDRFGMRQEQRSWYITEVSQERKLVVTPVESCFWGTNMLRSSMCPACNVWFCLWGMPRNGHVQKWIVPHTRPLFHIPGCPLAFHHFQHQENANNIKSRWSHQSVASRRVPSRPCSSEALPPWQSGAVECRPWTILNELMHVGDRGSHRMWLISDCLVTISNH